MDEKRPTDEWVTLKWVWCKTCDDRQAHEVLPDGMLKCEVCSTVRKPPLTRKDLPPT